MNDTEADILVARGYAWIKQNPGRLWYDTLSYSKGIELGLAIPVLHFGTPTMNVYAKDLKAAWLRKLQTREEI